MGPMSRVQGDTWTWRVQWVQPTADGRSPDYSNPVDVTGFDAKLQVRRDPTQNAVLSLTSDPAAGLTIDPTQGVFDVRAEFAQTGTIPPGTYQWELEIDNGADRLTLVTQPLVVKPQVTV